MLSDSYLRLQQLLLQWEKVLQNTEDRDIDQVIATFQTIEAFFLQQILPIESPATLRFHVEMHRLFKLIASDLQLFKTARSAATQSQRLQSMLTRSASWRTLCDGALSLGKG